MKNHYVILFESLSLKKKTVWWFQNHETLEFFLKQINHLQFSVEMSIKCLKNKAMHRAICFCWPESASVEREIKRKEKRWDQPRQGIQDLYTHTFPKKIRIYQPYIPSVLALWLCHDPFFSLVSKHKGSRILMGTIPMANFHRTLQVV